MLSRAVFLDKDGTLLEDVPYNVDPEKMRFYPDAIDGMRKLSFLGYQLIIISNQGGLARGFFSEEDLERAKGAIKQLLSERGIAIKGFYCCPHDLQGSVRRYSVSCQCRKPRPGLILKAAADHNIDLKNSWMIGDILHDIEAGNRAGCGSILIDRGNETEWEPGEYRIPDFIVNNMRDAVSRML